MRHLCVLLILLGLPPQVEAQEKTRTAQSRSDRGRGDHRERTPDRPPSATVNAPGLPAIGLPPTVSYQRPWEWRQPVPAWERPQVPAWERQGPPAWERGPRASEPFYDPRYRRRPQLPLYPTYGIGYSYGVPYVMMPAVGPAATPEPPPLPVSDIGYLRLEVEPAPLLQIYVDGVYVGTPADHRGELELRAGPHRIEVRAPGHEPLTFDVRVEAERGITYRGDLRPIGAPSSPPAPPIVAPTGSKTLYVIPGCYLGNVAPDKDRLPAGCEISRMKTHAPQ